MQGLKYLNTEKHYVSDRGVEIEFTKGKIVLIPEQISMTAAQFMVRRQPLSFQIVEIDEKPGDITAEEAEKIEPDFELVEDVLGEEISGSTDEPEIEDNEPFQELTREKLENMTVKEIRIICEEKGIATYGTKKTLIDRIIEEI